MSIVFASNLAYRRFVRVLERRKSIVQATIKHSMDEIILEDEASVTPHPLKHQRGSIYTVPSELAALERRMSRHTIRSERSLTDVNEDVPGMDEVFDDSATATTMAQIAEGEAIANALESPTYQVREY